MTIKRGTLTVVLGLAIALAGFFIWRSNFSHGQGSVESHEHFHVHGTGVDHGHEHEETTGEVSHSHAHKHDRHYHDSAILPEQPDLTEVGHSHDSPSSTTHYWAKLSAEDGGDRFVLKFFESREGKIKDSKPKANSVTALIFNGSKLDKDKEVKFEKSDDSDNYVAEIPGFLVLPAHLFKFENLEFGDMKFDVLLSVEK